MTTDVSKNRLYSLNRKQTKGIMASHVQIERELNIENNTNINNKKTKYPKNTVDNLSIIYYYYALHNFEQDKLTHFSHLPL